MGSDPAAVRRRKRTTVPLTGDVACAPGKSICAVVQASEQES